MNIYIYICARVDTYSIYLYALCVCVYCSKPWWRPAQHNFRREVQSTYFSDADVGLSENIVPKRVKKLTEQHLSSYEMKIAFSALISILSAYWLPILHLEFECP